MKKFSGFSLIELMVVMAMVSILSAMALKGYSEMVRSADEAAAQKEISDLSMQLETYRSSNLTYKGFSTTSLTLPKPLAGQTVNTKYTINIVDADTNGTLSATTAKGVRYAIKATPSKAKHYAYLLRSDGAQCKNKTASEVDYQSCGTALSGSEAW